MARQIKPHEAPSRPIQQRKQFKNHDEIEDCLAWCGAKASLPSGLNHSQRVPPSSASVSEIKAIPQPATTPAPTAPGSSHGCRHTTPHPGSSLPRNPS